MSRFMTAEQVAAHQAKVRPGTVADVQRMLGIKPTKPKRNKYNNIPTEVNGEIFESRKEARQYFKLLLRQGSGQISGLQRQVPYPMVINGVHVCDYIADWTFYEGGKLIVGDAKGHKTDVYKLKKRLMFALHGLEITES